MPHGFRHYTGMYSRRVSPALPSIEAGTKQQEPRKYEDKDRLLKIWIQELVPIAGGIAVVVTFGRGAAALYLSYFDLLKYPFSC